MWFFSLYNSAWSQPLPAGEKFVLLALVKFSDETLSCFPGHETLAGLTGLCERTVGKHLRNLRRRGLIQVRERFRENGTRTSDKYRLMLQPEEFADGRVGERKTLNRPPEKNSARPPEGIAAKRSRFDLSRSFNVNDLQKSQDGSDVRNTKSPTDKEIRMAGLVNDILEVCGDRKSLRFYRKVAKGVRVETIGTALSETRLAKHQGRIHKTPGAFFVDELKRLMRERGEGELSDLNGRRRRGDLPP